MNGCIIDTSSLHLQSTARAVRLNLDRSNIKIHIVPYTKIVILSVMKNYDIIAIPLRLIEGLIETPIWLNSDCPVIVGRYSGFVGSNLIRINNRNPSRGILKVFKRTMNESHRKV